MAKLTKADIDGLVAEMETIGGRSEVSSVCLNYVPAADMRRELYLAAGLTAEGQPKPEKVRCWLGVNGTRRYLVTEEGRELEVADRFIPGWFVPDGAE